MQDEKETSISQWYAVQVMAGREMAAAVTLMERQFAAFLPMQTDWAQPAFGPREPRRSPLIPGYLFVLCAPEDFAGLHELGLRFVEYVRDDGVGWPMAFPLAVVLGLQCDERAGLYDSTRVKRDRYRPRKGETVKIGAGKYYGFVATVLATPRGDRCSLMISHESFAAPRKYSGEVKHLAPA